MKDVGSSIQISVSIITSSIIDPKILMNDCFSLSSDLLDSKVNLYLCMTSYSNTLTSANTKNNRDKALSTSQFSRWST